MTIMHIQARHYQTGTPLCISIENGCYTTLVPLSEYQDKLPWIAPGLIDVQVNGFGGVDFNRPVERGDWKKSCTRLQAEGCTGFLTTLITHTSESYNALLPALAECMRSEPFNCLGIHLEGPFLNPAPGYHGAHRPEWMTGANLEMLENWQSDSRGKIRLITLAPEMDDAASELFIRHATSHNIRVSIGHSAARDESLQRAISAGASCWTHLGNALPRTMDKFDNELFSVLAEEKLLASLIPDPHHLPPSFFRVLARTLGARLLLTTDAMSGAGAPPGPCTLGDLQLNKGNDGAARHPTSGRPAGSTLTPFEAVFNAAEMSGLPWSEMWHAMSVRPAHWLDINHGLDAGMPADFCLFQTEPDPKLLCTYLKGQPFTGD